MNMIEEYRIQKGNRARIAYIDIAKGIGILLVVLGHCVNSESQIAKIIYSFHMPLFFMVAGMVYSKKQEYTMCDLAKKELKLLVQYLFWACVFFVFDIVVRLFWLQIINARYLVLEAYEVLSLYGINVTWFLSTLFLVKVLFALLVRYSKNKELVISLALTVGSVYLSNFVDYDGFVGITKIVYYPLVTILRACSMVLFFEIGYLLKQSKIIESISEHLRIVIAILLFVPVFIYVHYCSPVTDVHYLAFGKDCLFIPISVLGSIAIIVVSSSIADSGRVLSKVLTRIGENSLMIMVLHEYFMIRIVYEYVLKGLRINEMMSSLIVSTMVLVTSYVFTMIIKTRYDAFVLRVVGRLIR